MADPLVEIEQSRLQVNPGGQVTVLVTVRNTGRLIEGFKIEVLGDVVQQWGSANPPELRIDVGREASSVIVFTPPKGMTARSGALPFAVRAMSLVDSASSAVVEGEIEVGRVFGLTAKLTPVTSTARWRGRHRAEFTNWGNAPVHLRLSASDPDERLGTLVTPESLVVPLGGTVQATVRVRTRRPFLRGSPVRLPFQVIGEPFGPGASSGPAQPGSPDDQRQVLDGALMQKPIISKPVIAIAALLVAAAVAIAAVKLLGGKNDDTSAGILHHLSAPSNFKVAGVTPTSVILSWTMVSGAASYVITYQKSSPTNPTEPPIAVASPSTETTPVPNLQSGKRYCFEIATMAQGSTPGKASAPQCRKTSPKASNAVNPPEGFTVDSTDDTSISLTWTPDPSVAGYKIWYGEEKADGSFDVAKVLSPKTNSDLVGGLGSFAVVNLMSGTTYCFQLIVTNTEQVDSKPTDPQCGKTTGTLTSTGGGGSTPTSTGVPQPNDWVLVVKESNVPGDLQSSLDTLRAHALSDAQIVPASQYPVLAPGLTDLTDYDVLIAGAWPDQPTAEQECSDHQQVLMSLGAGSCVLNTDIFEIPAE